MTRNSLVSAILTASFLLSPFRAAAELPPNAYADAVLSLAAAGVIDGGGNVRLNEYVNRAEALKIILKAQERFAPAIRQMQSSIPPMPIFPDIDQTAWYAPYVEVGFKYGLVKGYPDGWFWPSGGVKVSEAAAMLTRSFGFTSVPFASSQDLPNLPGQWYTDALSAVNAKHAVLAGSRLDPGAFMTRGQIFDMVYRMRTAELAPVQVVTTGSTPGVTVPTQTQPSAPSPSQFLSTKDFAVTIPSLGIVDLTVTHPEDPYSQKGVLAPLENGVGHLFSYPGQGGKIMIYGHSSGYPWDLSKYTKIFRTINEAQVGDLVYVTYKGTMHVYRVSKKQTIPASSTSAIEPDEHGEELILYTCWPPDSIQSRYLVYAEPV